MWEGTREVLLKKVRLMSVGVDQGRVDRVEEGNVVSGGASPRSSRGDGAPGSSSRSGVSLRRWESLRSAGVSESESGEKKEGFMMVFCWDEKFWFSEQWQNKSG